MSFNDILNLKAQIDTINRRLANMENMDIALDSRISSIVKIYLDAIYNNKQCLVKLEKQVETLEVFKRVMIKQMSEMHYEIIALKQGE